MKRFGEFTAVDGIDVDVYPGESFGYLGPVALAAVGLTITAKRLTKMLLP